MRKAILTVLLVIAAAISAAAWLLWERSRQPPAPPRQATTIDPNDRVAVARAERLQIIEEKYHAVAVDYPGEVFIRWLKHEAVLELWARSDAHRRFRRVASYPILASSGIPGPKHREGDKQVPEGFYEIVVFNPLSSYHLSMGLNYPNAADLVNADPQQPGSDIYIHGSNESIGCAPLGDEGIEEVYLAAADAKAAGQTQIPVHIFPARMSGPEWEAFSSSEIERRPELADFWAQLKPAYDSFERRRVIPDVEVTPDGKYVVPNP